MKQADRCCIDCVYYDSEGKECHKFPPRLHIKADGDSQETVTLWPSVYETNWCGAFEAEQSNADIIKDLKAEEADVELATERQMACKLLTSVSVKEEDIPAIIVSFSLSEIQTAVEVLKDTLGKEKGGYSPTEFIKIALKRNWRVKKSAVTNYFQGGMDYLKSFGKKDK